MKPGDDRRLQPPVGAARVAVVEFDGTARLERDDWVVDERPVALEFNGVSHAVMLASPRDLEDFALGFALTEGLVDGREDLRGIDLVDSDAGITVQLEISSRCFVRLKERRRTLAGRTGCGLCGTENLAQVLRPIVPVPEGTPIAIDAIERAMRAMDTLQPIREATGAAHAAAWCGPDGEVRCLREDVGRHNALDKLVGALARDGRDAADGFVAVTSRASVEMVQKAVALRAPLLAAVSAPTALAIEVAQRSGMSLLGLVRGRRMVAYTGAQRVAARAAGEFGTSAEGEGNDDGD